MADAAAYQKLDHREHVLRRPGMYIGSVEPEDTLMWVFDPAQGRMVQRTAQYVPGLLKVVDEILMNAVDHGVRLRRLKADGKEVSHFVKKIAVSIDRDTGVISVENDGEGIPVQVTEHAGADGNALYVPELIFGHMLTSANYDDEADAERTLGGQNGIGAKACNVYSRWFEVETVDATRGLLYRQRFEDNMAAAGKHVISACKKKPYTRVTFLPDYARFGAAAGLTDDAYQILCRRVYDIAAVTPPDVAVLLNCTRLPCKSFDKYCDLYLLPTPDSRPSPDSATAAAEGSGTKPAPKVYEVLCDGWELAVALSGGGGFQQVSFVNGVATIRGGKHVDQVASLLCKRIAAAVEARRKAGAGPVKQQYIKDNLFLFLRATVPNPTFDSQSKETLTTPASKLGNLPRDLPDRLVERVLRLDGLVDRVVNLSDVASERGLKKTDGTKRATISGLPKLEDAEWAGTARSDQCTLILTEGDSAKAMAIAGLAVVGRQRYGVYPLRGKVLNVFEAAAQKIADNPEISALKKILGLQSGRVYETTKDLRYGRVMVLADSDADGSHIKGLIMNLFAQQWRALLERCPGFLCSMLTPMIKASRGSGKTLRVLPFYNAVEYAEWKSQQADSGVPGGGGSGTWRVKYYKGLGTSTAEEAREYFGEMRLIVYSWTGAQSADALDLAFNKRRANDRKALLANNEPPVAIKYDRGTKVTHVPYEEFVGKELKQYSLLSILRAIPSVVDGLKVSQRKVLYCCFKRNLREEIRVAQLAGYVSEHAAYHHGEASLHGTIVCMAQDYVGSNNVNLLKPKGQFGTRLAGGHDQASPRYIHTYLTKRARLVYPAEDDAVVEHHEDDGLLVEPRYYLPVLPMVLVNGAVGIATAYSTSVPCHNPLDVIEAVRDALAGREIRELKPWYRGFKGSIEVLNGRVVSRGLLSRLPGKAPQLHIAELPVGTWTDDFKEALEAFVERTPGVKGYSNASTDAAVSFTLTFQDAASLEAWLAPAEAREGVTRLEEELKLFSISDLSTTNMHLFDASGSIRKYADAREIVVDFYHTRLAAYERRRALQIEVLAHEALVLSEKVRFLDLVVGGSLALNRFDSESLDAELSAQRLVAFDGGYRYLTAMPMSAMTADKKRSLEAELRRTQARIEELQAADAAALWTRDLDRLAQALCAKGAYGPKQA